jgi:hypothetical protein
MRGRCGPDFSQFANFFTRPSRNDAAKSGGEYGGHRLYSAQLTVSFS